MLVIASEAKLQQSCSDTTVSGSRVGKQCKIIHIQQIIQVQEFYIEESGDLELPAMKQILAFGLWLLTFAFPLLVVELPSTEKFRYLGVLEVYPSLKVINEV